MTGSLLTCLQVTTVSITKSVQSRREGRGGQKAIDSWHSRSVEVACIQLMLPQVAPFGLSLVEGDETTVSCAEQRPGDLKSRLTFVEEVIKAGLGVKQWSTRVVHPILGSDEVVRWPPSCERIQGSHATGASGAAKRR